MLKIQPLTVNIGCATSFIQAGQIATAAVLRKREPQKSNSAENPTTGSISAANKAPLVVYGSDSSPTNNSNQASSLTVTSRSVLFVILSGASAFSIITLAFVIIYRRYKAQKLQLCRLYPSEELRVTGGRPSIEKTQIRHITHDEQKERYRSLFGVPAGYLRPTSLVPQPTIHSLQAGRYSDSYGGIQDEAESDLTRSSSSSHETEAESERSFYRFTLPEHEPYKMDKYSTGSTRRPERNTKVISFVEDSPRQIFNLKSADVHTSRISPRFPDLVVRLESINPKSIHKTKSINRINPHTLTIQNPTDFKLSLSAVTEEEQTSFPRSPSIAATPPSYMKSESEEELVIQKPVDLAIVTDRLERQLTLHKPTSFRGRGDSYYWKSPPRSE